MALTPEQIEKMNNIARGGIKAQPSVPTKPTSKGFLADEEGDWGVTKLGKSLSRNLLSAPVEFGKTLVKLPVDLTTATTNLVSNFASKHLGEDNPFVRGMRETGKDLEFGKTGLDMGTLGKTSENIGGKTGQVAGTLLPYFASGGLGSIPARIAADTLIATGQTGNFTEGAKTGLVSSAIESIPVVGQGLKLLKKTSDIAKPMTKGKVTTNVLKNMAKGGSTGYVADVASGLAGQRGEENTGVGAFVPGLNTAIGTAIGSAKAYKPLKQDLKTLRLNDVEKNIDYYANFLARGVKDDIPKFKRVISALDPNELKKVKTQDQATEVYNKFIKGMGEIKDAALEKNQAVKRLDDLSIEETFNTKLGTQTKDKENYVAKALNQMEEYYNDIGKKQGLAEVKAYIQKAKTKGLTAKDINEISKLHAADLSAFNPTTNKLSTGLEKQNAENTRKGLKTTVESLFGNEKQLREFNKLESDAIRVRDLSKIWSEKISKDAQNRMPVGATGKIKNAFKNIGYGIRFMLFKYTGSLIDTDVEKLTPPDIEKLLNKTLNDAKSVIGSGKSEAQIIKSLDDIGKQVFNALPSGERLKAIQEFEQMKKTKLLPAPTSDFQGTPLKLNKETQSTIDAREKGIQKEYKKMSPKLLRNREKGLLKSQNPLYKEAYKKPEEMPSIQVGSKPKKKDNLPIIKY